MTTQGLRIALIDDHPLVREGLAHLLEVRLGATISHQDDGRPGVVDRVLQANPELIVLDLHLGDLDGLEVLSEIKLRTPGVPVLVVSMHEEPSIVARALERGASGYVLKTNDTSMIPVAVQTVLKGERFVSSSLAKAVDTSEPELSPREHEVVQSVAKGLAAKEIAARLGISHRTVEVHRANAMKKLNAKNIAELAQIAARRRWV